MPWDKGWNFRQTSGYVTDGANETYAITSDTYPTTRNGATFGWTVAPSGDRDRNSALDRRIAGIAFGSGVGTFRVDLPATGSYSIRLAMGDSTTAQTASKVLIKDNTSTVLTIGPHNPDGAGHYDATNTYRSNAAWPGSNVAASLSFATTTLFLTLEVATTNSVIAHLFVSQTGGGGGNRRRRLIMGAGS